MKKQSLLLLKKEHPDIAEESELKEETNANTKEAITAFDTIK